MRKVKLFVFCICSLNFSCFFFSLKNVDHESRIIANSNGDINNDDKTGTNSSLENASMVDVPMLNLNKPKNEIWSYRSSDLKPLQNNTEYVPVYGDKNKSHTACNDERWRILGTFF